MVIGRLKYVIRCIICTIAPSVMFLVVIYFDSRHAAWPADDMYYYGPSSYFEQIRWPILTLIMLNAIICILSAILFFKSSKKALVLNVISSIVILLVMVSMIIEIVITASAGYHTLHDKRIITPIAFIIYLGCEILFGALAAILQKANHKACRLSFQ